MRILTLLLLATSLCLPACATSPARDAKPATDLQVLVLAVKVLTEPRRPAGDIQHLDEAETYGQAWDYAGDVEEALWLAEGDKARVRELVTQSAALIEAGRLPACRWWQRERAGRCRH